MDQGKALPEFLRTYTRHVVTEWIGAEKGRSGLALAKKIGVSKAHISTIRGNTGGAGYRTARALAAMLGMTFSEYEAKAQSWWEERQRQPPLRAATPENTRMNVDMLGWPEAEKRARVRSTIPDWCFLIARRRTGLIPKDGPTPEYVTAEAVIALQFATPEEALRDENQELDHKIHTMRSKRAKRKSKRPIENSPPES